MIVTIDRLGGGQWRASVDGRVLVRSSHQPFLAAARVLLAEGADPSTAISMRHRSADYDALRSTVSAAARLTVSDRRGAPQFERLRTGQSADAGSPMRQSGKAA